MRQDFLESTRYAQEVRDRLVTTHRMLDVIEPRALREAREALERDRALLDAVTRSLPHPAFLSDLRESVVRPDRLLDSGAARFAADALAAARMSADATAGLRTGALAGAYHVGALGNAFQRLELERSLERGASAALAREYAIMDTWAREASALRSVLAAVTDPTTGAAGWVSAEGLSAAGARRLVRGVDRLTRSAGAVWEQFAAAPAAFAALPELVRDAPTLQVYTAARGVSALVGIGTEDVAHEGEARDDASERATVDLGRRPADVGDLAARLDAVGPGLAAAYRGAMRSVRERGDDYARHTAISLRELLEALLTRLAPDVDVCAWHGPDVARSELYDGSGKMKRAARLKYLYRGVGNGAYARHVEDEVKLIQQTFLALNDGAHGMPVALNDEQVAWLVARVNGQLLMILAVAGR